MAFAAKGMVRGVVRLAGSALFLALLFEFLPARALGSALGAITLAEFIAVLAVYCAIHVGAAAKWWLVLGRRISFGLAVRTHFAGLAANLFLPGATGGDAVRAVLAHASLKDGPRVTAAAMADRLIDVVSLVTLTLAGLVLAHGDVLTPNIGLVLGLLIPLITLGIATLPRTLPLPWKLFPRLPGHALGLKLATAFGELGRRKGMLLFAFASSLAIQFAFMALSYVPAVAMAGTPAFADWTYAWPLSKIVSFLPISINGLGVREGALAALLAPTGASTASVVASGLVWQGVMIAGSGIGVLIYLMTPGHRRELANEAAHD